MFASLKSTRLSHYASHHSKIQSFVPHALCSKLSKKKAKTTYVWPVLTRHLGLLVPSIKEMKCQPRTSFFGPVMRLAGLFGKPHIHHFIEHTANKNLPNWVLLHCPHTMRRMFETNQKNTTPALVLSRPRKKMEERREGLGSPRVKES